MQRVACVSSLIKSPWLLGLAALIAFRGGALVGAEPIKKEFPFVRVTPENDQNFKLEVKRTLYSRENRTVLILEEFRSNVRAGEKELSTSYSRLIFPVTVTQMAEVSLPAGEIVRVQGGPSLIVERTGGNKGVRVRNTANNYFEELAIGEKGFEFIPENIRDNIKASFLKMKPEPVNVPELNAPE